MRWINSGLSNTVAVGSSRPPGSCHCSIETCWRCHSGMMKIQVGRLRCLSWTHCWRRRWWSWLGGTSSVALAAPLDRVLMPRRSWAGGKSPDRSLAVSRVVSHPRWWWRGSDRCSEIQFVNAINFWVFQSLSSPFDAFVPSLYWVIKSFFFLHPEAIIVGH